MGFYLPEIQEYAMNCVWMGGPGGLPQVNAYAENL